MTAAPRVPFLSLAAEVSYLSSKDPIEGYVLSWWDASYSPYPALFTARFSGGTWTIAGSEYSCTWEERGWEDYLSSIAAHRRMFRTEREALEDKISVEEERLVKIQEAHDKSLAVLASLVERLSDPAVG